MPKGGPCSFPGCTGTVYSGDWCSSHTKQRRRGVPLTPIVHRRPHIPLDILIERVRPLWASGANLKETAKALEVTPARVREAVRAMGEDPGAHASSEENKHGRAHMAGTGCPCQVCDAFRLTQRLAQRPAPQA